VSLAHGVAAGLSQAKRVAIALDACHAGSFVKCFQRSRWYPLSLYRKQRLDFMGSSDEEQTPCNDEFRMKLEQSLLGTVGMAWDDRMRALFSQSKYHHSLHEINHPASPSFEDVSELLAWMQNEGVVEMLEWDSCRRLVDVLRGQGRHKDAKQILQRFLTRAAGLKSALAYVELAKVLCDNGECSQAQVALTAAVGTFERLGMVTGKCREYAACMRVAGNILWFSEDPVAAAYAYRDAIAADPDELSWDLARALSNFGELLRTTSCRKEVGYMVKMEEALVVQYQSLEMKIQLAAAADGEEMTRPEKESIAYSRLWLAHVYRDLGHKDAGSQQLEQAIQLLGGVKADVKTQALGRCLMALGKAAIEDKDIELARRMFEAAGEAFFWAMGRDSVTYADATVELASISVEKEPDAPRTRTLLDLASGIYEKAMVGLRVRHSAQARLADLRSRLPPATSSG